MYFFYQQDFSGQFKPRKQIDAPKRKTADGNQKSKMSQIVELPSYHREMSIDELAQIYPLHQSEEISDAQV